MVQRTTAKACDMAAKVDSILEKTFLHPQDHFHTAKPSLKLD